MVYLSKFSFYPDFYDLNRYLKYDYLMTINAVLNPQLLRQMPEIFAVRSGHINGVGMSYISCKQFSKIDTARKKRRFTSLNFLDTRSFNNKHLTKAFDKQGVLKNKTACIPPSYLSSGAFSTR